MKTGYQEILSSLGPSRVRLDESMSNWTTFRIGGPSDLFYEAKTTEEIVNVVSLCRSHKIPYFVLGGGSNLLVSDKGIRGMVIKISNINPPGGGQISNTKITVGAGVPLAEIMEKAAQAGLSGLEFAVGIPGTVGGAIVGNAGAWQQAIGDRIKKVLVLCTKGEAVWLDKSECGFTYRGSRFKDRGEIVLEAELELSFGEETEIRQRMEEYLVKRKGQPKEPSAGCIFVNPKPLSAGTLVDQSGLKGVKKGDAQISQKHANFVINLGSASCQDVLELITLMKDRVEEKEGIKLIEEIKIIGDFNG